MTGSVEVMNPNGLSAQAEARKARSSGDMPLPDLADPAAVVRWRAEQHRAWGEDVAPGEPPHRSAVIGGVSCLVAGPDDVPPVVYLHGGGFCLGSPGTAVPITARLAAIHRVVSVGYRLSPEHPCPAAIDDVVAVCASLATEGPFALAGDSAGANIALSASLKLAEKQQLGPAALALLCPHLDFRLPSDREAAADDATLALGRAYLGGRSTADPLASPLARADEELSFLPSVLIQTTDTERMHGQALDFAARTPQSTTLQVWRDLWHGWHYHRELPEAWDAVDGAAQWLAPILRDGRGTVERDGW